MQSTLDKEWVYLMLMAREMGLSKEQVRDFIQKEKENKSLLGTKP